MTRRTAKAVIVNNTGKPLTALSLIHKYSDNYKNKKDWASLPNGQTSDELWVEYNTGAFTTGRDWWKVTWFSPDMHIFYETDPYNARGFIDLLESGATTAISEAAKEAAQNSKGRISEDTAKGVAQIVSSALFNSEKTAGFKQHILRDGDEGKMTEFVLNSDRSVTIKSPSGTSETRYTWRDVSE